MDRITEQSSLYNNLEQMSTAEILQHINDEDHKVAVAVKQVMPAIEALVDDIVERMKIGGRLFYIGSGTSGRLGVVDASECPPTFGVPQGMVVGLIAGGDSAIRKAVEGAEDDPQQGWLDLLAENVNTNDVVIGIAASGSTPYVVNALKKCKEHEILTGCITSNPDSAVAANADHPVAVITGPEFITGSTRMKSGTAQKLVLNMISTSVMVRLGKVKGNKMVDMQLSNDKLVDRGTKMLVEALNIDYDDAKKLLLEHGSVRKAMERNK